MPPKKLLKRVLKLSKIKPKKTFLGLAVLLSILLLTDFSPTQNKDVKTALPILRPDSSGQSAEVLVTRVVDGDTIEIEGGKRVRYIGVDTPEIANMSDRAECYALEAKAKNKSLVEGKRVKLNKDVSGEDAYGRLLRYVFIGDLLVNEVLVREGFAHVATFPPDVSFQERFLQAERYARENSLGLWGGCNR